MAVLKVSKGIFSKYKTIGSAIEMANPGDRIEVEPGSYNESLQVTKPLEIVGTGNRDETILACEIYIHSNAEVTGVSIYPFKKNVTNGIKIINGKTTVRNCKISDIEGVGMYVASRGSLAMSNTIFYRNKRGISVYGWAEIEDCQISDGEEGIFVSKADAKLSNCLFNGQKATQIFGKNSTLDLNHIQVVNGDAAGIILDRASASLNDCEVTNHVNDQVAIINGSHLEVTNSRIAYGEKRGFIAEGQSSAVIVSSLIYENQEVQVEATENSTFDITDTDVHDGGSNGIAFTGGAEGTIEESRIYRHGDQSPQVVIMSGANPVFKNCQIADGDSLGVWISQKAQGVFEQCQIYGNQGRFQICIENSSTPKFRNSRIEGGTVYGIYVDEANPVIEDCQFSGQLNEGIFYKGGRKQEKEEKMEHVKNSAISSFEEEQIESHTAVSTKVDEKENEESEAKDENTEIDVLLGKLEAFTGMEEVKEFVKKTIYLVKLNQLKKDRGLKSKEQTAPHMIFQGNPGTGKTTVARLMGEVFKALGLLEKGHLVEVRREDLVREYIGHTEKNTQEKIEEAMGGVLFIDEAYTLNGTDNDFGPKAIEVLLPALTNYQGKFVVIAAGYQDKMAEFLAGNPGLKSRFTETIVFEDYLPEEMLEIFQQFCTEHGNILTESARKAVAAEFIKAYRTRDKTFGNIRFVQNFFDEILKTHANRILSSSISMDSLTDEYLLTFTEEDIDKVLATRTNKVFTAPVNEELLAEEMEHLQSLIGLESVKEKVDQLVELVRWYKKEGKELKGLLTHILLTGNPGTGKTEVARILSRIFAALGVLERGDLIEVDRHSLVDKYIGGTEEKTGDRIGEALGGTLFIDEAYTLTNKGERDQGLAAVEIILKKMSDLEGQFMVIAAGYEQEMEEFLNSNAGLARRFQLELKFEDYRPEELIKITKLYLKEYVLSKRAEILLIDHYESLYLQRDRTFGNAGLAKKIATESMKNLHYRLSKSPEEGLTSLKKLLIEEEDLALLVK